MRSRYTWLIGPVLALAVPGAWAQGGRISFSGAVVEPTCSAEGTPDGASQPPPADRWAPGRLTCGQTPTRPGRSYSRRVVSLDAAAIANDRLLDYFASYANAGSAGGVSPKLVVRTYE
jgi:hypothetical protein